MNSVRIIAMNGWEVFSYGNGLSYLVKHPCGKETYFQDNDATIFRNELERWSDNYPEMFYSEILRNIMSEY